jgi:aspartyl protease family protein
MSQGELPRTWKVVTVWLLLGLAGTLGVQAWLGERNRPQLSLASGTIELKRAPDGHYHWPGRVNGQRVDFLVDTGATRSALPATLARELKLPVLRAVSSQTAGGQAQGELVQADLQLEGGVQLSAARMVALPKLETPLLGMDVLGRLQVRISGDTLTIEPGNKPLGHSWLCWPRQHSTQLNNR